MQEIRIVSDHNEKRLDVWLANKLPELSRSYIKKMIQDGNITVNQLNARANTPLKVGDEVYVRMDAPKELKVEAEDIPIDILYEDDDIIVVNKQRGLVVHPAAGNMSGTLVNALMKHCKGRLSTINGIIRPGIVHRIDKDTSGVLVVAKNDKSHEYLGGLFKNHDITRVYFALVHGVVTETTGKIDMPIGRHTVDRKKMSINSRNGRHAVTYFEVLERFRKGTHLRVKLETGRTHQIRVHLAHIGYPVIGDPVYGIKSDMVKQAGQLLHAGVLGFVHPRTGQYKEFEAKAPEDYQKMIHKLKEM